VQEEVEWIEKEWMEKEWIEKEWMEKEWMEKAGSKRWRDGERGQKEEA
jgi:hypothetical protein